MNTIYSILDKKLLFVAFITLIAISEGYFVNAQEFKGVIIVGATAAQIDGDDLGGFDGHSATDHQTAGCLL